MSERLSDDLLELLGEDAFLALVENFGGDRLYVPKNAAGTVVEQALGIEAATKLARAYGGDYPRIPLARDFRARKYRAARVGNAEIARRLGMTRSGVERLFQRRPQKRPLQAARVDPRQQDLFQS